MFKIPFIRRRFLYVADNIVLFIFDGISIRSCCDGKYYKTVDRVDSRPTSRIPSPVRFFIFHSVHMTVFYYFYVDTPTNFCTIKRIIIITSTGQRTGTKFCSYMILHTVELCRTYSKRYPQADWLLHYIIVYARIPACSWYFIFFW